MDYCYGKNYFNFGVDPTQNGRLAAVLDFRYNIIVYSRLNVIAGAKRTKWHDEGLCVWKS